MNGIKRENEVSVNNWTLNTGGIIYHQLDNDDKYQFRMCMQPQYKCQLHLWYRTLYKHIFCLQRWHYKLWYLTNTGRIKNSKKDSSCLHAVMYWQSIHSYTDWEVFMASPRFSAKVCVYVVYTAMQPLSEMEKLQRTLRCSFSKSFTKIRKKSYPYSSASGRGSQSFNLQ